MTVYFLFWQILDQLWQILFVIGQVFNDVNGQMLENSLAIWSHTQSWRVMKAPWQQHFLQKNIKYWVTLEGVYKHHFKVKAAVSNFWATFVKIWATFYSKI